MQLGCKLWYNSLEIIAHSCFTSRAEHRDSLATVQLNPEASADEVTTSQPAAYGLIASRRQTTLYEEVGTEAMQNPAYEALGKPPQTNIYQPLFLESRQDTPDSDTAASSQIACDQQVAERSAEGPQYDMPEGIALAQYVDETAHQLPGGTYEECAMDIFEWGRKLWTR